LAPVDVVGVDVLLLLLDDAGHLVLREAARVEPVALRRAGHLEVVGVVDVAALVRVVVVLRAPRHGLAHRAVLLLRDVVVLRVGHELDVVDERRVRGDHRRLVLGREALGAVGALRFDVEARDLALLPTYSLVSSADAACSAHMVATAWLQPSMTLSLP
jgi:hypothetical protein